MKSEELRRLLRQKDVAGDNLEKLVLKQNQE